LLQAKEAFYAILLVEGAFRFGHGAGFLIGLYFEQSRAMRELTFAVRTYARARVTPRAIPASSPHALTSVLVPYVRRACCQLLLRETTLDKFVQIDSLDDDLANFVDFTFEELGHDYINGNLDGDDYVSPDELFHYMLDVVRGFSFGADHVSFSPVPILTRGEALLAVMMADRDGNGKLSMAEMQTIVDEVDYIFRHDGVISRPESTQVAR
jgi:hypothetical protein